MPRISAWKGWERAVAGALRQLYPEARRTSQAHHRSNKAHGNPVPDIDETPFWVECHWVEDSGLTWNQLVSKVRTKWAQADRDKAQGGDARPVLVCIGVCRGPRLAFFHKPGDVVQAVTLESQEMTHAARRAQEEDAGP